MKTVSLLLGIHMHQPVDNFGDAVDEAIAKCYGPFFRTMVRYSDFKFAVHCSGWLFDQIRIKHPDIFADMATLTHKGAIEWISAGYYEPVLSAIPSRDRRAQIKKLNDTIETHLGVKPTGLWLTERVWESALVPDLHVSGIEYAVVDDYHFLSSGFEASRMDGYYRTEEGGHPLALFPISQALRYALPFFSVERSVNTVLECARNDDSAAIIFDDAEKFGLWPKTHEWVYEKKWLEGFVEAILSHPQIVTRHYGEYLRTNRSRGIAYLNNTSYFEMGEWSLHPKQTLALEALKKQVGAEYFEKMGVAFIKGGIWKNFFVKYHESNYLHKRMLGMSLEQERFNEYSREALYKLQTNDVFWHGVFGGLYLPNLRDNAYRYLLEIERAQSNERTQFLYSDIDMDGFDEFKMLTSQLCTVFSAKWGAQMVEFGSLQSLFNWQNTLMRREEAYHDKILHPAAHSAQGDAKEDEISTIHHAAEKIDEALKAALIFDWHPKHSFVDHFSDTPFTLEGVRHANFREIGDFANQPFTFDLKAHCFERQGGIYHYGSHPTTVQKSYKAEQNVLELEFACKSDYTHPLHYGMEFNFHFAHPHLVTFNTHLIGEGLELSALSSLEIIDDFTRERLTLTCNAAFDLRAVVLHTVSQSESGFDLVAQQVCFMLDFPFTASLALSVRLEVDCV